MKQTLQQLKTAFGTNRLALKFILLSFAMVIALSWLADFSNDLLKVMSHWSDAKQVVLAYAPHLILSAVIIYFTYRTAKNAWEESFEIRTVAPYPKAGICFLSSKSDKIPYNPWEMNTAFVAHYPSMAYLLVISSEGKEGSHKQYDVFVEEIKTTHPNIILIHYADHHHTQGENFLNLTGLKTVCKNAYQLLADHYQCDDSDIVFDATSGTKECSIAATLSTLKDGRYLHYTNKHKQGTTFDIHE